MKATAAASLAQRVVEHFGRLDVLVNSASIFEPDGLEGLSAAQFEAMHRIHVIAPALLAQAAWRYFQQQGETGRIVNIVDVGALRPWQTYISYCCSKAGLIALTKALAKAMAPHATVNAIALGVVEEFSDLDGQRRSRLLEKIPLRRFCRADEVASVVLFLVRDATYMTGQVVPVDGGRSLI